MRTIMIALQFFMRIRMLHCPLHYYAAHYTITLSFTLLHLVTMYVCVTCVTDDPCCYYMLFLPIKDKNKNKQSH